MKKDSRSKLISMKFNDQTLCLNVNIAILLKLRNISRTFSILIIIMLDWGYERQTQRHSSGKYLAKFCVFDFLFQFMLFKQNLSSLTFESISFLRVLPFRVPILHTFHQKFVLAKVISLILRYVFKSYYNGVDKPILCF